MQAYKTVGHITTEEEQARLLLVRALAVVCKRDPDCEEIANLAEWLCYIDHMDRVLDLFKKGHYGTFKLLVEDGRATRRGGLAMERTY